jgi:hypothetical protein
MTQSESELQKQATKILSASGLFFIRNHMGSIRAGKLRVPNPNKGIPDLMGMARNGRAWFMELKSQTGILSDDQVNFRLRIQKTQGLWFLIRSIDDLISALKIINSEV